MRRALLALTVVVAAALPGGAALAQAEESEAARQAMEALRAAAASLEAAESAKDRVAALTETVRAYEKGLEALREGLRTASLRERAIRGVFAAQSERLARLLGVLESIEAAPEPSLLLHPSGPLGTVRAGMIVSDVTPALTREARQLRAALEEVATLRALQESAVTLLEEGLAGVQTARTELSQAMSERRDLPRRLITDDEAMANLLNSADTLESFAAGLLSAAAEDSTVPVTSDDFFAARGTLELPVLGRVIRRFDEPDAAGVRRPGWIIATRPLSLVTTPWPATVRYLGPLLDYGQVAVLEPAEGVLLVLAGLGQVFGEIGQVLPRGSPVGLMGGTALASGEEFLITSARDGGTEASESLYLELRWNGAPVDPAEWFAGAGN
ncbi:MAG: peptidase M23 [Alphaproteobacteria bacterium]|nr:MAG: peptidase M23 [Alphaproteobacteria bacterium]